MSSERTYGKADEVRPEYDRQHAFPESEVEKSDRKKPPRKPGKRREAVVFDFYLFHNFIISNRLRKCLSRCREHSQAKTTDAK